LEVHYTVVQACRLAPVTTFATEKFLMVRFLQKILFPMQHYDNSGLDYRKFTIGFSCNSNAIPIYGKIPLEPFGTVIKKKNTGLTTKFHLLPCKIL
jgi:hypothetical protein